MISVLAQTFYLGANAKVQAIRFALCLALGLAGGIIALLYLRKARPVERALTDFFATVVIGALFFICVEFFLDGKFELYGFSAYILGVVPIPFTARKLRAKRIKKQAVNSNQADDVSDETEKQDTDNKHALRKGKHKSNDDKSSHTDADGNASDDSNGKTADSSEMNH